MEHDIFKALEQQVKREKDYLEWAVARLARAERLAIDNDRDGMVQVALQRAQDDRDRCQYEYAALNLALQTLRHATGEIQDAALKRHHKLLVAAAERRFKYV